MAFEIFCGVIIFVGCILSIAYRVWLSVKHPELYERKLEREREGRARAAKVGLFVLSTILRR